MTDTLQGQTGFYTRMLMGVVVVAALMVVMAARPAHAEIGTVTNTNDSGAGSLRWMITAANNNPGIDTLKFDIDGTGVHTIQPTASNGPLPTITDPLIINGYSQSGSSPNTLSKGINAKLMIQLDGSKLQSNGRGIAIDAPYVVIKGLVINRFTAGIHIYDKAANTRIEGNFIGTNPSGTSAYAADTSLSGVDIYDQLDTTNNIVGGSTPAARNLISGYTYEGVNINSDGNKVSGNLIGTQRDGKSPLGNNVGVRIYSADLYSSSNNVIGGEDPAYANTIAFNNEDGIVLNHIGFPLYDPLQNSILFNSIYSNGALGIDLGADGPTANDSGDADSGSNNQQNYPVLSSAKKSASDTTTIKGTLNSTPGKSFTVQFFSNPTGTVEGKNYLGSKSVMTDGSGNTSFSFSTTKKVGLGQNISATATISAGGTSEFSTPRTVAAS